MIRFENLTKSFRVQGERRVVIDNLNATLPTGRSLALLGRNGAGKSTLLKILAGTMRPDSGQIITDGLISWPVGFGGSFHGDLTGAQNVRFIARIYGVDTDSLLDFVQDFAELGKYFHMPVRSYSSGMRSRLTFGASMGIRVRHLSGGRSNGGGRCCVPPQEPRGFCRADEDLKRHSGQPRDGPAAPILRFRDCVGGWAHFIL